MTLLCRVYRSARQAEMYLYVDALADLSRVPPALLERFGEAEEAVSLVLRPERKLARASAADVIRAIEEKGFYLQLPPAPGQGVEAELDRLCAGPEDGLGGS